jgi:mono/diheme cytochrome c family protein
MKRSEILHSDFTNLTTRVAATVGLAGLLVLAVPLLSPTPGLAQTGDITADDQQLGPVFMLSLGGKLYDDPWPILDLPPPQGRNPAFADPAVTDYDTWRCVSCHGWDYSGAGGERAGVAPGAGAASLVPLKGADPSVIIEKIIAPSHPFPSDALPDLALFLLGAFISDGQYDRDRILDENGHARGDPEAGRAIFEGACINCHELDGRAFLQGEIGDPSSLGKIARDRPEQALHKIMNGVPLAEMLSLRFLSEEAIADLMAYVQTLDTPKR